MRDEAFYRSPPGMLIGSGVSEHYFQLVGPEYGHSVVGPGIDILPLCRENECDSRPTPKGALDLESSRVGFGDRPADSQPESVPIRLWAPGRIDSIEAVKDMRQVLSGCRSPCR